MSEDYSQRVARLRSEQAEAAAQRQAQIADIKRQMTPLFNAIMRDWHEAPELAGLTPEMIVDADFVGIQFRGPYAIRYDPLEKSWAIGSELITPDEALSTFKDMVASWIIHEYSAYKESRDALNAKPQSSGCAIFLAPLLLGPLAGIGLALFR